MPKKPKNISPEQAEINRLYRNARRRLTDRLARLKAKNIIPIDYTLPKVPKKKELASIRKLEKEVKRLESKSFINLNTGEVVDYTGAKKTKKPKTITPPAPPQTPTDYVEETPEEDEDEEEFDEEGYDLYQRYLEAIDSLPPAREFSFGRGKHRRIEIRDYSEYIEELKSILISRFESASLNPEELKEFFDDLRENEEEFFDLVQEIIQYAGDPIKKFNELFSIISNRPITIQDRMNTAPLYAATQPNFEIK